MIQTHKAINQLQKEIRQLKDGIASVEALIVEKQKTIESLQQVLNEQQQKVIDNVKNDDIEELHERLTELDLAIETIDAERNKLTFKLLTLYDERLKHQPLQDVINSKPPKHTGGAEDAIYNNIHEDTDVGMAGVSYWNMIDTLGKNVADIINNPNATAESVLQRVEQIKRQVKNIKAEFENKYMK